MKLLMKVRKKDGKDEKDERNERNEKDENGSENDTGSCQRFDQVHSLLFVYVCL